ncbi:MAG: hypothetical protein K9L31_02635 [Candidatus Pacebacteria bacterium]|nr:hypothetical protein [Candidatus Paceibacterota bacterium]
MLLHNKLTYKNFIVDEVMVEGEGEMQKSDHGVVALFHVFTRVSCVDAGMPHGVSLWDERANHTLGVSKQRSCLKP